MADSTRLPRRDVLAGMAVAAGAASTSGIAPSANAAALTETSQGTASVLSKGWKAHISMFDEVRERWLNSPWAVTEDEKARALFQVLTMEHVGFNSYLSPLHAHPAWSKNMAWQPLAYQWGLCNPDFPYQFTFLNGARSYRIWGKRGTPRWTEFHIQAGFWGDDPAYFIGTLGFDEMDFGPDGSFEIIASPEPHDGNWIKLDPMAPNIMLFLRNVAYDWTNDQLVELHIETLDQTANDKMWNSLEHLDQAQEKVAKFMQRSTDYWFKRNEEILTAEGYNRFWQVPDETANAGNSACKYVEMIYKLEPDEAAIIETDLPTKAAYWGVQLCDMCWQTLDFTYHQSCLNGFNTVVDSDGRARFVLSQGDPGVANWLDTTGVQRGAVAFRWVEADVAPVPTVKKVPLAEVREHLPADTKFVSTEERAASLAQRRKDVWRLYGV